MDDIVRQSQRDERRANLKIGLLLVAAGLAVALGTYSLTSGRLFLVAIVPFVYGLALIARGLGGSGMTDRSPRPR
jgi:hypothetical protein